MLLGMNPTANQNTGSIVYLLSVSSGSVHQLAMMKAATHAAIAKQNAASPLLITQPMLPVLVG